MRKLLCVLMLVAFVLPISNHAQSPQYVAMPLNKKPAYSGCQVVQSLADLKTGLQALGYTSTALPVVDWSTKGAVIIASNDGTLTPYSYQPSVGASLRVITNTVAPNAGNYLFVMTIDKVSAQSKQCFLQGRNVMSPASIPTTVKGGSSTNAPVPQP